MQVGWEGHRLAVDVKADRAKYAVRDTAQVSASPCTIRRASPRGPPMSPSSRSTRRCSSSSPTTSWNVLDAMMGQRPLGVVTSTAQMQVVGKRHYGKKAVEAGGGGGDASAVNRENFQPVLLWKGHVPLDAQGRARVAGAALGLLFPASASSPIATDGEQMFGTGETSLRTSQNLSIYSGLPPARADGRLVWRDLHAAQRLRSRR